MIPGVFLLIGYILLMGYALFNMVVVGAMLAGGVPLPDTVNGSDEPGVAAGRFVGMIFGASIPFIIALAGLAGSIKMIRLRSRGSAMAAAVMAIFPFCFCFPIGIWAVVVLSQENVQRAFEANDRRQGG